MSLYNSNNKYKLYIQYIWKFMGGFLKFQFSVDDW